MAATRRAYTGGAQSTTTTSNIASSGTTSFTITAYTGWPYGSDPFFVVVEPGTASEEKILVTRTGSTDTTINIASDSERGQDGTSAVAHSSGSTVFPVFTALDADEANAVASVITADTTNGRVGIGTDSPVGSLSVDSSNRQWSITNDSTNYVTTKAHNTDDDSTLSFHRHSASRHHFSLNGSTDAMLIDSSGNVGINDVTPSYTLDVNGDINATGDLRIGGTAIGEWTAYTPVLVNITLGSGGTNSGRYALINKVCHVEFTLVLGTGGSVSGLMGIGFPPGVTYSGNQAHGRAFGRPVAGAVYFFTLGELTGGRISVFMDNASGTYVTRTNTAASVPGTWASGGFVSGSITFEVA